MFADAVLKNDVAKPQCPLNGIQDQLKSDILIPLLAFPEALLNGMAVTLLVVYQPQWLFDYSDREYLWRK